MDLCRPYFRLVPKIIGTPPSSPSASSRGPNSPLYPPGLYPPRSPSSQSDGSYIALSDCSFDSLSSFISDDSRRALLASVSVFSPNVPFARYEEEDREAREGVKKHKEREEPAEEIVDSQPIPKLKGTYEQKVRTYHSVFSNLEVVGVYEYPWTAAVWLIPSSSPDQDRLLPRKVAGRSLYLMPEIDLPQGDMILDDPFPGTPIGPLSHYSRFANAVKMKLNEVFPTSVGIRILRCGVVAILFSSEDDVDDVLLGPRPETFGGLVCFFAALPEFDEVSDFGSEDWNTERSV